MSDDDSLLKSLDEATRNRITWTQTALQTLDDYLSGEKKVKPTSAPPPPPLSFPCASGGAYNWLERSHAVAWEQEHKQKRETLLTDLSG